MNDEPDRDELLAEAVKALRIRDVMLNESRFWRPTPPPTDSDTIEVGQRTKRAVRYVLGDVSADAEGSVNLLQVIVALGIRIVGANGDPEKAPIYFEIEADFLVEYDVTIKLSDAAISAFADNNSVHNVWPFWRQHVFDTVSRGRLPHLDIPLFGGVKGKAEQRKPQPKAAAG
jgi:hypothetical protein